MDSTRYPRSEIEAKWRRAFGDRPGLRSSEEVVGTPHLRFVATWPGRLDERRTPRPRKRRGRTDAANAPAVPAGREIADLSFLRRLVVADTHARLQRHHGRPAFVGWSAAGFGSGQGADVDATVAGWRSLAETLGLVRGPAVVGSDPRLYRFAQWIFLELFAREHIFRLWRPDVDGSGERPQWRVDLGSFAERLFADVDKSSWSAEVRKQQKALIGRRRGTEVLFPVSRPLDVEYDQVSVFTTRIEAIFGATFLIISPRHQELILRVLDPFYEEDVTEWLERYRRGQEPRDSGVRTGGFALNPANLERIPIVISPLADTRFSGGIRMAVPAHDRELFRLARLLRFPVREVIHSADAKFDFRGKLTEPWIGDGSLTNSGPFSGSSRRSGREKILSMLGRRGMSHKTTRYALESLALSDLDAGGPPVPLVHCERCGVVPVSRADLPVVLPEGAGTHGAADLSLAAVAGDMSALCPSCGAAATRDPGTLRSWFLDIVEMLAVPLGPALLELELPREPVEETDDDDAPNDAPVTEASADEAPASDDDAPPRDEPSSPDAPPADDESPSEAAATNEAVSPDGEAPDAEASEAEAPDGDAPDAEAADAEVPNGDAPDAEAADVDATTDSDLSEGEAPEVAATTKGEAAGDGTEDSTEEDAAEEDSADEDDAADSKPRSRASARARRARSRDEAPEFRPLHADFQHRMLPADVVFAPERVGSKDLVGARLVTKFLYDQRQIPAFEPFRRFFRVGDMRLLGDSTERDDAPSDLAAALEHFGADALRVALLARGSIVRTSDLSVADLYHARRFLDRMWREIGRRIEHGRFVSRRLLLAKHRMILRVTERTRRFKFHTAFAAIREFVAFLAHPETTDEEMDRGALETFAIVVSPFVPFLAQELWERLGKEGPVLDAEWPAYSEELLFPADREIAVWIDGRVRHRAVFPASVPEERLGSMVLDDERVRELIGGATVSRVVAKPGQLVAIALEPAPVADGAPAVDAGGGADAGPADADRADS